MSASASRPRSAMNSSRSWSSQRAWRSSSGRLSSPAWTSEMTSSRETITDEDSGIDLAAWMRSSSWWRIDSIPISSTGCSSSTSRKRSLTVSSSPSSLYLVAQRLGHRLGHEGRDVAAEAPDLPHELGGEERPLGARRDEDRLDAREVVVHLRHLHLGLEVRDGPEAPDDGVRADVAGDPDGQRRHRHDPDGREVRRDLLEQVLALLEVEERAPFWGLRTAATTTSSKSLEARSTISRCPLWNGSKEPGRARPSNPSAPGSLWCATVMSVPPYRRSLAIIQSSGSAIGDDDQTTLARIEGFEQGRPVGEVVGRVAERKVVGVAGARRGRAEPARQGGPGRGWRRRVLQPDGALGSARDRVQCALVGVDEGGAGCTPRERLHVRARHSHRTGTHHPAGHRRLPADPRMSKIDSRTRAQVGRTDSGSLAAPAAARGSGLR